MLNFRHDNDTTQLLRENQKEISSGIFAIAKLFTKKIKS